MLIKNLTSYIYQGKKKIVFPGDAARRNFNELPQPPRTAEAHVGAYLPNR